MKYLLAEACQNTFILFDCLNVPQIVPGMVRKAHEHLVKENKDDALILACGRQDQNAVYARLFVVGMDGHLAEFCGNGARACAAYLYQRYPEASKAYLCSPKGTFPLARHAEGMYSIELPKVVFEPNPQFIRDPKLLPEGFHYAEVLEPHLIVNRQMDDEELMQMGRTLNKRQDLFPQGINVNSWYVLDGCRLFVKTYERGVQRLTKSCGTGSVSCAASYQNAGNILVQTPGGLLEIHLQKNHIKLKGPANCWEQGGDHE